MDKTTLKLAIIKQIIACDDEIVLEAILNLFNHSSPTQEMSIQDDLAAALLGENPSPDLPAKDEDIDDLQGSIDEIFG